VIHHQGANNLPDAQSQLVVTMFAPPGMPVLTVVSVDELAERRHRRFTRSDDGNLPVAIGSVSYDVLEGVSPWCVARTI
jgi:hypothetical protein